VFHPWLKKFAVLCASMPLWLELASRISTGLFLPQKVKSKRGNPAQKGSRLRMSPDAPSNKTNGSTPFHKSMKKLICLFVVAVIALSMLAQAQAQDKRADIDKDVPLAEAISRSNKQYPDSEPLNEQEVIVAVQAIKIEFPDLSDEVYQTYQRVAKEHVLPKGMYFSRITSYSTQYGLFTVDWRDLTLQGKLIPYTDEEKAAMLKKSQGGNSQGSVTATGPGGWTFTATGNGYKVVGGFNYRIRARFISSQPSQQRTEKEVDAARDKTRDAKH
jgi:hypothetical protein